MSGLPGAAVDVVIVAYRSAATIGGCLESLAGEPGVGTVIVVDNDSPDDSAARAAAAGARVVRAGSNRGFGAGCNLGVAASSAPYILLLNPDAAVLPGTLAGLRDRLAAAPGTAAAGSELRSRDGGSEPSRRRRPSLARAPLEPGLAARLDERHFRRRQPAGGLVDWVGGACLLVRRDAFDAIGGFDERYFLYAEEADLCARLRRAGWTIAWWPGYPTVHHSGYSTGQLEARGKLAWVDGWLRYAFGHHPHPQWLRRFLLVGLYGRVILWSVLRRPREAAVWSVVASYVRTTGRDVFSGDSARNATARRSLAKNGDGRGRGTAGAGDTNDNGRVDGRARPLVDLRGSRRPGHEPDRRSWLRPCGDGERRLPPPGDRRLRLVRHPRAGRSRRC